ncbi:hypothetical protein AZE42_00995, partial [Rhizopogon vesiculosus]
MASPSQQLPPGWAAEWDPATQRYLFTEPSTGRSQWEVPTPAPATLIDHGPSGSPPLPATHHTKRRQYAAGQTQAYYGTTDGLGDQYGALG